MVFRNIALGLAACVLLSAIASAQWIERPLTGSSQSLLTDRTMMAGMSGLGPQLEVSLVDPDKNAAGSKAVIRVEVWGVELVQPQSNQEPKLTLAYITYQLDSGEVIRSAEKQQTFSHMIPGYHHIYVQLASLDGQPVGARLTLTVDVPK